MTGVGFFSILLIGIGLSADCFAVALGAGVSGGGSFRRRMFRLAVAFGFFQALMLIIGFMAGRTVVDFIAAFDHWVAFGLLVVVSGRMLWEAFGEHEEKEIDISRGLLLLTLSVATSIDSLAVGLSFAFLDVDIVVAAIIVGAVAFTFTAVGFALGKKTGELIGKWAEVAGAIILLAIALRVLLTDLLG